MKWEQLHSSCEQQVGSCSSSVLGFGVQLSVHTRTPIRWSPYCHRILPHVAHPKSLFRIQRLNSFRSSISASLVSDSTSSITQLQGWQAQHVVLKGAGFADGIQDSRNLLVPRHGHPCGCCHPCSLCFRSSAEQRGHPRCKEQAEVSNSCQSYSF